MGEGLGRIGRRVVRWSGHIAIQVAISLVGTACLALLSNLYFGGGGQSARAGTPAFDLSTATIAAQTFAPQPEQPAAAAAAPPQPSAAVSGPAASAPPLAPAVTVPDLDHRRAVASGPIPAPPLRLVAMTMRPEAASTGAPLGHASAPSTGRRGPIASGAAGAREILTTIAAWGDWLTRLR
jgi:hypothetical protein